MATKKILVSDNSGSTQELPTAHIGYNDTTNQISASKITAYNISSSLPSGILQANGNFISGSVITGSGGASGSLLQISGSRYTFNLPTNIGGDLSGSTTDLGNVKVISVANVNSGTLPFARGGTGLSSALSGVLIKGAGDTLQVLATSDTGSVIGLNVNGWFIDATDPTTNYKPRVDVYNTSGSGFTWTKYGNPRFLKITVIGGGGGGAGGVRSTVNRPGGSGGGGGGNSQVILEAANVTSGTIFIGAGGTGGAKSIAPTFGGAGTLGGTTSFSASNGLIIYATGGGGATINSAPNPPTAGSSGGGSTSTTQDGGTALTTGNSAGNNGIYSSGGGAGGSSYSPVPASGTPSGITGIIYASASFGSQTIVGSNSLYYPGMVLYYYLNNNYNGLSSSLNNPFLGTGGGGGGGNLSIPAQPAGDGGYGIAGGGGGGGGSLLSATAPAGVAGNGGNGGSGLIIIESY